MCEFFAIGVKYITIKEMYETIPIFMVIIAKIGFELDTLFGKFKFNDF